MGRAGFVSGSVYAQNLQGGIVAATLGGTGTDTVTVTFPEKFRKVPAVVALNNSTKVITAIRASSITLAGCTLTLSSSSLTGSANIGYVAFDDSYN
jgi:hypothetical protein